MSLSTAPARTSPTRAPRRPAPQRPQLRLVEAGRRSVRRQAARVPFPVVCATLLMLGLLSVLVLNMTISQASFALAKLQTQAATLDDHAVALRHDIDDASSSRRLAEEAGKLGMAPAAAPLFLDPETGRISGDPEKAHRKGEYTIVTGRAAAAPPKAPSRAVANATSQAAGLGLGGGLVGAVAALAAD